MLTEITNMKLKSAPLSWKIKNLLRIDFITGWLNVEMAKLFSKVTGIPTIVSCLKAMLFHNGEWIDYGVLGYKVVTTAGVGFLVDAWQNSVELEIMKYHGCGTGAVAEAIGDTTLGAECTTVLNPDSTRATGTLAEGATANIFSSVGTLTFDGNAAVTEHGLCSTATSTYVLWDRTVFSAINVVSTDTIQFTYQVTFPSGG